MKQPCLDSNFPMAGNKGISYPGSSKYTSACNGCTHPTKVSVLWENPVCLCPVIV